MKDYFKYFKIPFIVTAVCIVLAIIIRIAAGGNKVEYIRTNTQCDTNERVFDYADKLSDKEENNLREQIAAKEKEVGCDIVIVTLDQSLVDYAAGYKDIIGSVPIKECIVLYADNFFDEHKFGYNKPSGDGVVFVDNWYREADGSIYSRMTKGGKAFDRYSSEMIDEIMNTSLENVADSPYKAYSKFVGLFANDMSNRSFQNLYNLINPMIVFIAAFIISIIFLIANWSGKKGKKTINEMTYLAGGRPEMRQQADIFLYKNVTKRHIERNTGGGSGGGGGGHISMGGSTFGGGTHTR